ncbi:endo-1,4-beta-xylanase [candidate division KSB1 bacterium]|nr:endo-1,4-beta-xylanase [candidate division KSB1 bacterium]RQW07516.1 MAG: T9SS C-terminal target domain-containing protein [candidate division KSB1 bacterium]
MKIKSSFCLVMLMTSFLFSQTDAKFDAYLAAELANLPAAQTLYNCANVGGYRYGGGVGAIKKIVNADSTLPFGKVVQLTVAAAGANSWEPQFQSPANTSAVQRDDVLFYVLHIRALESVDPSGNGKGFFYVQRNSSPWTGLGSSSLAFTPSWRKVYVVAQAGEDYPAGSMEFTVHLGFQSQKVEIGGIIAVNLGQNIDISELPHNPLYWDGMQEEAPWRIDAAARIDQHRKGDLQIVVVNQNRQPIKGAEVKITMTKHAFGFGTFMSALALSNSPDAQKYKEHVLRLFNRATTPFYMGDGTWGWYGPGASQMQYPDLAQWLMEQNIPTKGHVLIWPSWTWMPPFFRDYENDAEALRAAIDAHLDMIVPIGQEKELVEWDVVNEPHINHDVMDICGEEIMVHWYNKVHELDPLPRLILNEYNILMAGGGDAAFQADFERYIELLLSAGAPLGGIGMQCHFDENLPGIPRVVQVLDRFAKYNLPIQITEFDIDTYDEEGQARFTRDFFTAVFSHPMTDKIIMWGFWEGDQWRPSGAMIRKDWSYKPNYNVYEDLLFHQWWTNEDGLTTRDGVCRTRGFLGDYQISVAFDGRTVSQAVSLTKEGATVEIQIPTTETQIDAREDAPADYGLENYPNPFNASTVIEFTPEQSGAAELVIHDARGVQVLAKKLQVSKGICHREEIALPHFAAGAYFYSVNFPDGGTAMKKMMLVK